MATSSLRLIDDFLGSVQIFASTMQELLETQLRDVTGTALVFSQLKLLTLVASTEGHSISDLAGFLGVSTAAASKAVDRLVRRGLLRRRETPSDRRSVTLSLTTEGQAVLQAYQQRSQQVLAEVFEGYAPDLEATARVLDRLSLGVVGDRLGGGRQLCFRCGIHFRDRCLLRQSGRACFYHLHKKGVTEQSSPSHPHGS